MTLLLSGSARPRRRRFQPPRHPLPDIASEAGCPPDLYVASAKTGAGDSPTPLCRGNTLIKLRGYRVCAQCRPRRRRAASAILRAPRFAMMFLRWIDGARVNAGIARDFLARRAGVLRGLLALGPSTIGALTARLHERDRGIDSPNRDTVRGNMKHPVPASRRCQKQSRESRPQRVTPTTSARVCASVVRARRNRLMDRR